MKIAFGYKMGSGKDTSVNYLISKYGGTKISFAEPIYKILTYTQNICKFKNEKDRQFLQYIGTDWARSKNPDVWINILLIKSQEYKDNIYVSDLRFINEFNALKKNEWICIKINRYQQKNREGTGNINHKSEYELDNIPNEQWDYIIDNNDNIEKLYSNIDDIIQSFS